MNGAVALHKIQNACRSFAARQDLDDLLTGKRSGHLGKYGYTSGAADSLVSFFQKNYD